MTQELIEQISQFKKTLITHETSTIIRKYITFGESYVLNHDKHYDLKAQVADHFGIHPNEVLIVGSAKLGFSISRGKRFRFFGDQSDIDVAIISSDLFDKAWKQVFDYRNELGYWEEESDFKKYLFRGWIRPDKLPPSHLFSFRKDWWEFFRQLTASGAYGAFKIAGGLYRSWHFLESYQSVCVRECKQDLENAH